MDWIAPHAPTLGENEVVIKRCAGGNWDVFSTRKLTPEQLQLLCKGQVPDDLDIRVLE